MRKDVTIVLTALILCSDFSWVSSSYAQSSGQIDSVGRGWPLSTAAEEHVGAVLPFWNVELSTATGGESPAGIEPLERDIFSSDDFYIDRELWTDPRYFRCNSPLALDAQWGDYATGPMLIQNSDPETGAWGHCDRDYPRESIVSPYPFATAQAHYEALLAETKSKGGPTTPTYEESKSFSGRFMRNVEAAFFQQFASNGETPEIPEVPNENREPPAWILGHVNQMPTILSLLTEEYQTRLVQQLYHQAHGRAAQWSLMYCRPEGFMRYWSGPGYQSTIVPTPDRVELIGGTGNAARTVYINREFNLEGEVPRLGEDVRRWFGESVGFWDEDSLIVWTSNIQGWMTHASWDHSSHLQTIEIFTKRFNDAGEFSGLVHETIFYDPEAFVEPVRNVRFQIYTGAVDVGEPRQYEHCIQTIFPIDGRGQHVSPGTVIKDFVVPNLYDRPWTRIWEDNFEQDMQRPIVDLFKF